MAVSWSSVFITTLMIVVPCSNAAIGQWMFSTQHKLYNPYTWESCWGQGSRSILTAVVNADIANIGRWRSRWERSFTLICHISFPPRTVPFEFHFGPNPSGRTSIPSATIAAHTLLLCLHAHGSQCLEFGLRSNASHGNTPTHARFHEIPVVPIPMQDSHGPMHHPYFTYVVHSIYAPILLKTWRYIRHLLTYLLT